MAKSLLLIFLLLLGFLTNSDAQTRAFLCTAVHDGDTFTVTFGGVKLNCRIENIDCPEISQPYGTNARDSLAKYILNKIVIVQLIGNDTYGRKICHVWVASLNRRLDYELVARGWAWYNYLFPAPNPVGYELMNLQTLAKSQQKGLWFCNEQIPPWEWRKYTAVMKRYHSRMCTY